MNVHDRGEYSAAASALGYLYQIRYALSESLRRLRKAEQFVLSIETLDDVVFEVEGEAVEILQTKHHLNRGANLTDGSPDLWKTLRIWCEAELGKRSPENAFYFLITTASAVEGSAAYYLKQSIQARDNIKAMERLNATVNSSTSATNRQAYDAFKLLTEAQRANLLDRVFIFDASPSIGDLGEQIREDLFFAVEKRFLNSFLQRLEGWWFFRVIQALQDDKLKLILSEELESETSNLREQFKLENLPIDLDILSASVDASGYQDRVFVEQLRLIEIGAPRIVHAIKNYFRAFEQRSRWVREDLLFVGELGLYENRLMEEWDVLFQQMRDELDEDATEDEMLRSAQTLYKWVETAQHIQIRPGVTEPFVSRGTYHMLSDAQRVGWHTEFSHRVKRILDAKEMIQ